MSKLAHWLLPALVAALFAGAAAAASWDQAAAELRSAALPDTQAAAIVSQAQARAIAPDHVIRWAQVVHRLAQQGSPSMAGERLLQGLAKDVAVDRIDTALARLEADVTWLRTLTERLAARVELRSDAKGLARALREMEAALRSGLERDELERVLGPGPLTLSQISALARAASSLRSAGADAATVQRVLGGLGTAGIRSEEIERLDARFAAALAKGTSAEQAVADFDASLREAVRASGLVDRREALRDEVRAGAREAARSSVRGGDMRPGLGGAVPDIGGRPGR